jgi:dTDP-4-amino-4,6-dideoxygalactose transaminase
MRWFFWCNPEGDGSEGILSTFPRGARIILTHKGRTAIYAAARALDIGRGDQVVVPAYNCGSEIDPLLRLGAEPIMYEGDPRQPVNPEALAPLLGPRVRAVYVTHYWGFVQPLKALQLVCRDRGIALIEDAALALLSAGREGPVGRFGDVAVFSFAKSLPVPDGGALVVNSERLRVRGEFRRPGVLAVMGPLVYLVRPRGWCADAVWRNLAKVKGRIRRALAHHDGAGKEDGRPDLPATYYFRDELASAALSGLSSRLLPCFDPKSIVLRRRSNYTTLAKAVERLCGAKPLFPELSAETCPLVFPLLVENRDAACVELNQRGIAAIPWWAGYHRRLGWEKHPLARFLKDHVLALPVHQQINAEGCAYMAEVTRDLSVRGTLRFVDQETVEQHLECGGIGGER